MTAPNVIGRLTLLAHAPTRAQRDALFPRADEAAEEAGLAQAALLAEVRALRKVDRLWTAPETRARQTADALAGALGVEAHEDTALADLDVGAWQGRSLADLSAHEADAVGVWLSDPEARPHGAESLAQLRARVARWLEHGTAEGHTLAVTHPAVIRMAVAVVLEAPPRAFWRLDIAPLSLTDLRWHRRWAVRATGVDALTLPRPLRHPA
ncbi:histidine phosphatase family protein [Nitrospirillum viridazoti]|uniref:Phosphoglycerate mutase n=1 Tax=Nitrospirillum viridazoti CBAmc TaxID=1441467 RepID=A0A248K236_9PROT|nr:histidine phosphatase family protein [Nitrospirillum amazonense]ASG25035.1 phosphoglycerate mutase [Nitrospirillum amazonense CBAmc]TWB31211.1 broad specificity phosphatase PhoE [Nitrospirillum amazonense]